METTRSLNIEPSVHIDITLKSAIGRQHERAALTLWNCCSERAEAGASPPPFSSCCKHQHLEWLVHHD
jgi:hypothetical protein